MICYIGLGANLGNRVETLRAALEDIKKIRSTHLLRVSAFYETAPWGVTNQPNFINAAAKISTTLEPTDLLDELQRIEASHGRVRTEHWGARTLDLDILKIDGLQINSSRLTVPHQFLSERDFAIVPLNEIATTTLKTNGQPITKTTGSPADFKLKFVASVDKNSGLGFRGQLLFKDPADLKNFRALTTGHTVIYGRNTLATLPNAAPLAGRRNIIFTRTTTQIAGATTVHSVNELWRALNTTTKNFVIGGAQIFAELMPYAAEIFLTTFDSTKTADAFFPNIPDDFAETSATALGAATVRHFAR